MFLLTSELCSSFFCIRPMSCPSKTCNICGYEKYSCHTSIYFRQLPSLEDFQNFSFRLLKWIIHFYWKSPKWGSGPAYVCYAKQKSSINNDVRICSSLMLVHIQLFQGTATHQGMTYIDTLHLAFVQLIPHNHILHFPKIFSESL